MLSFSHPPFWPLRVSPLGSIPKKHTDKRRRISDLSYPADYSVNAGIDVTRLPPLRYATVQDAANMLLRLRALPDGASLDIHMAKVDVQAASFQLPVREQDWWQLAYVLEGKNPHRDCRLGSPQRPIFTS